MSDAEILDWLDTEAGRNWALWATADKINRQGIVAAMEKTI